jgi:hypothetical protein
MKSFATASFVAVLALAPSAFADKYLTEKTYSDSACTYLTEIQTYDVEVLSGETSCATSISSCASNDASGYVVATCGSSLLGEIGDNAYLQVYSDTACSTTTPFAVIPMACAWFTGNELYQCGSFNSALAIFFSFLGGGLSGLRFLRGHGDGVLHVFQLRFRGLRHHVRMRRGRHLHYVHH